MINVNETTQNLYKQDSAPKNLTLTFTNPSLVLTNADIVAGSFELSQILSDEDSLRFGGCNIPLITITLANFADDMIGKEFEAKFSINGGDDISIGKFVVAEIKKIEGKAYKTVTAKGVISKLDVDVSSWYNALTFPITVKGFRTSLLNHLNVPFKAVTLANDSILLTKELSGEIKALRLLKDICELNGCFGSIDNQGYFDFKTLSSNAYALDSVIFRDKPIYDTFVTKVIDGVEIVDDNGTYVQSNNCNNPYSMTNNSLCYSKVADDLRAIATNLFNTIKTIQYVPISRLNLKGLPFLELGDCISLNADGKVITSYVLTKTTKGIQTMQDSIKARGNESQNRETSNTTELLRRVNNNVVKVESDVNGLNLKVEDKVDKGTVSSEISLETDKVTISGDRLVINSTNCQLTEDGTLTCENAVIKGNVTSEGVIKIQNDTTKVNSQISNKQVSNLPSYAIIKENGKVEVSESSKSYANALVLESNSKGVYVEGDLYAEKLRANVETAEIKACNVICGSIYNRNLDFGITGGVAVGYDNYNSKNGETNIMGNSVRLIANDSIYSDSGIVLANTKYVSALNKTASKRSLVGLDASNNSLFGYGGYANNEGKSYYYGNNAIIQTKKGISLITDNKTATTTNSNLLFDNHQGVFIKNTSNQAMEVVMLNDSNQILIGNGSYTSNVGDTRLLGKNVRISARSGDVFVDGSDIILSNTARIVGLNVDNHERSLVGLDASNNSVFGYGGYANNEGKSYYYGNTVTIQSRGNINLTTSQNIKSSRVLKVLWSGALYMNAAHTITLSEKISAQLNGIVIATSWYDTTTSSASNGSFAYHFIPKAHSKHYNGATVNISSNIGNSSIAITSKSVYIFDDKIVGRDGNSSNNGNKQDANIVFRAIWGV